MKYLLCLLLVLLAGCSSHYRVKSGERCFVFDTGQEVTVTRVGSSGDDEILKKYPELTCTFFNVDQ